MLRLLMTLTIIFLLCPFSGSQGLKGFDGIQQRFGRLKYVKGITDEDRWKAFLKVQRKLVGMTYKEVETALGAGTTNKNESEAFYILAENPVKSGLTKDTWLHLTISFRNGKAWKYSVQAQ